jgi:hypothetical protein
VQNLEARLVAQRVKPPLRLLEVLGQVKSPSLTIPIKPSDASTAEHPDNSPSEAPPALDLRGVCAPVASSARVAGALNGTDERKDLSGRQQDRVACGIPSTSRVASGISFRHTATHCKRLDAEIGVRFRGRGEPVRTSLLALMCSRDGRRRGASAIRVPTGEE